MGAWGLWPLGAVDGASRKLREMKATAFPQQAGKPRSYRVAPTRTTRRQLLNTAPGTKKKNASQVDTEKRANHRNKRIQFRSRPGLQYPPVQPTAHTQFPLLISSSFSGQPTAPSSRYRCGNPYRPPASSPALPTLSRRSLYFSSSFPLLQPHLDLARLGSLVMFMPLTVLVDC